MLFSFQFWLAVRPATKSLAFCPNRLLIFLILIIKQSSVLITLRGAAGVELYTVGNYLGAHLLQHSATAPITLPSVVPVILIIGSSLSTIKYYIAEIPVYVRHYVSAHAPRLLAFEESYLCLVTLFVVVKEYLLNHLQGKQPIRKLVHAHRALRIHEDEFVQLSLRYSKWRG